MTFKVLIVDDEPANLRILERLFRADYQVLAASSGAEALRILGQHDVALLITDHRMPGMDGVELLKRAAALRPHLVRMILTGYAEAGAVADAANCGEVYRFVTKPWDNEDLRLTVRRALQHYEVKRGRHEAGEANKRLSRRVRAMTEGVLRAIVDALEAKDRYVCGHARRVSGYCVAVGRRMGLEGEAVERLALAGLMHDVGKISIPDSVLLKPGALDAREVALVRLHADRGGRVIAGMPDMEEVAAAVRHHHEDYDGGGYPAGLAGERIPLAARIIRVADAYDAMTSPRPFREARDHAAAVAELLKGAGSQYDPEVVGAFCGLDALADIRDSIAREDFGPRFLPARPASGPRGLGPEEMLGEVEADPRRAARVLRAANAGRDAGTGTASLAAACARLGDEALRGLVGGEAGGIGGEEEARRRRSVRRANAAKLLAEKAGVLGPEEAYTAGLLHDIGEALLSSLFPNEAEDIFRLGRDLRPALEVSAFGVDHAQVGQWVLDACNLPPALGFAIQKHHDANFVSDPAALLLHVADAVAADDDREALTVINALANDRLAPLGLRREDLTRLRDLVAETPGPWCCRVAA